jgi:hypothetical protein
MIAVSSASKPSTRLRLVTWEQAQEIANHASPKTTKLYDLSSDQMTLDVVERTLV